ncbi:MULTISPECIES: PfkB family carbohydrate kinase [unclassified Roseitalea]|uniref:carbohydrate kinase family protein n=1 Tax=unclassified Roseitalea TaxID=2639107 RepID=UPI00273F982E|nr:MULTISPECIES: PfkB family carbohydrate kinase [unclassified Roseitalea]
MTQLAVTGYASLDYPLMLDGVVAGNRTTHIRFRDPDAWPRPGGSPSYVGVAARRGGVAAAPVTWIGEDALGALFADHCRAHGLVAEGIETHAGARSPAAIMIQQADGTTACLYDPALAGRERLSPAQARVIARADHLCVTVGPGHLIGDILAVRGPDAPLSWVMKDDPTCFDAANRAALGARARIVFCNSAEHRLIADVVRSDALVVETLGAEGVRLHRAGKTTVLPAAAIAVADPTGAGDSFAGAFLAAHLGGALPEHAARKAMDAVRAMLAERAEQEKERGRA